jgi:broad specificity polyphosphatase/5'/3'-nucleotidase SurE
MTRILLTNDDGIHSDGLGTLERALREMVTFTSSPRRRR